MDLLKSRDKMILLGKLKGLEETLIKLEDDLTPVFAWIEGVRRELGEDND